MCHQRLTTDDTIICAACMARMNRINGYRVANQQPEEKGTEVYHGYVERLMWGQLPIERATAMFYYDTQEAQQLIHLTKYYNHPQVGQYLARVFAQELIDRPEGSFFEGIDCIVPMPIHWWRRWQRGYNQAELIAAGFAQTTGLPVEKHAVKRIRYTKSQTRLNHAERRENVKACFQIVHPEKLHGRHILLIDDVLTTGATMISLGQEIAKAEGVRLSILTLAWANNFVLEA